MAKVYGVIRRPVKPYDAMLEFDLPSGFRYGFLLGRPATMTFEITNEAIAHPELFDIGPMVTLERSDKLFPFIGFFTEGDFVLGQATCTLTLGDLASAIFAQARTPKGWGQQAVSTGELISRVWADCNARGAPPMVADLDLDGGTPTTFTPNAESVLDFLTTLSRATDWEWTVNQQIGAVGPLAFLQWRERIGRDRRQEVVWRGGQHFARLRLHKTARNFIREGLAIGGTGPVADRPAVAASPTGTGATNVDGYAVSTMRRSDSPALAGTKVIVEPQVADKPSLQRAARRLFNAPENAAETISFSLAESELARISDVELGSIYTVEAADLVLGRDVVRVVRIIGFDLGDDGIINVEAQLLQEDVKRVEQQQ